MYLHALLTYDNPYILEKVLIIYTSFHFRCSGTCKHAAAALFALADFAQSLEDRSVMTCIDRPCEWARSRKESKPVCVDKLDFQSKKHIPLKTPPTSETYQPIASHISDMIFDKLLNKLKSSAPHAAIHKCYLPPDADNSIDLQVQQIAPLPTMAMLSSSYKEQQGLFEINDGDDFNDYCKTLLTLDTKDICGVEKIDSKDMKHGLTWEPVARDMAVRDLAYHDSVKCTQTSLIVDTSQPFIAALPDGIISCECHENAVLEVKCSWKQWNSTWEEVVKDRKYHFDENGLKKDSSWMWQVQMQLGVCRLKHAYLAFLFNQGEKLYLEKVQFEQEMWDKINAKCKEFYENVFFLCYHKSALWTAIPHGCYLCSSENLSKIHGEQWVINYCYLVDVLKQKPAF